MRRFALIGKPLSHSFSASYFAEKFKSQSIEATYELLELESIHELRETINSRKINGFNVTIPYKQAVIPFLDSLSNEAKKIGAVNCVSVKEGDWIGHNTDALGFEKSLTDWIQTPIKNAIILGNGGSSKAVQFLLNKLKIDFKVVSRQGPLNYDNLHPAQVAETHLIVNTTPVGMWPNQDQALQIPYEAIGSRHIVMDLIYNPFETEFLKRCRLAGARTKNGLEMLHNQAEASWMLWNS